MQRIFVWLAILFVILPGVTARAAVDSTDLLIKALIEKQILTAEEAAAIQAEIAAARRDEEVARKSNPVSVRQPVKFSGYTQIRYLDAQGGSLDARRVRLTLSGDSSPDVDFKVQLELAGSKKAVTDNTFNTASFGKPVLLDAVLGVKLPENHRLAVGQFKVPFSLENLTSSTNLDTINRSQVTEGLAPGRDIGAQGRDAGIQLSGARPVGPARVEYAVGIFNGAGINTSDNNNHKDLAARVVIKPAFLAGVAFGLAHYAGAAGAGEAAHNRTGAELLYLAGPWKLQGEYIRGKDGVIRKQGWYVLAVRTLTPTLRAVARYDRIDPNHTVNTDAVSSLTGGITWLLSKDGLTRVQFNYIVNHEQGDQVENNQVLAQFQAGF